MVLVIAVLASAYLAGWRRLRSAGHRRLARGWRLLLYLAGLGALGVALLSPIERLASLLFAAHMVQHLLLTMAVAPLLLLGNPLPVSLWGLPRRARRAAGRLLARNAACRKVLWVVTLSPVAWLLHVGILWSWHLPAAYEAALRNDLIHDVEHLTFFGTALLFWWPIIQPAPHLHRRVHPAVGVVYLLAATGQTILLGALIALPERVRYAYYAAPGRPFGLSPLDDQALAGGIMWTSAHMYLIPLLLVVARGLGHERRHTRQWRAAQRKIV